MTPDGDKASTVTVQYVAGTAPDENWRNSDARRLIENQVQRLVVEAVHSKFENRPFDDELKNAGDPITQVTVLQGLIRDL